MGLDVGIDVGSDVGIDAGPSLSEYFSNMVAKAPVYENAALTLNAIREPVLYADFRAPREVSSEDVQAMLDLSDRCLSRKGAFVPLIRLRKGTGVISAQARTMFADWIEARAQELRRPDVCLVIVVPEAIFRAVLRVVYRFRAAPIRTITVPDIDSAVHAVRDELAEMTQPLTPELEQFLASISEPRSAANVAQG